MLAIAPGRIRIKVSDLLDQKQMTVADLVDATGMSYNTALALKRDASTRLDLETLARICGALDVEISDILEYAPA